MIKQYARFPGHNRISIGTNSYGRSLEFIDTLFAEAKKDFPLIERADVEVVFYGGVSRSKTIGIEFNVADQPPDAYAVVDRLEDLR